VKSYTQLVSSIRIASDVVARLGLHESPEQLVKQITAQSTSDSLVVNVVVTASSPTEAARTANTVDDVFKDLVEQLETSSTGVHAVEALIVQPATASAKPSSLGLPTMLALGLAGGLVAGLGACVARDRLGGMAESVRQEKNRVLASPTSAANILVDPIEDRAKAYQHHHTDER
jgi:capsular polysaccharide biosynthesis protein